MANIPYPFFPVPRALLTHSEFINLTVHARYVLFLLLSKDYGEHIANGDLFLKPADWSDSMAPNTYFKALNELIASGLIKVTRTVRTVNGGHRRLFTFMVQEMNHTHQINHDSSPAALSTVHGMNHDGAPDALCGARRGSTSETPAETQEETQKETLKTQEALTTPRHQSDTNIEIMTTESTGVSFVRSTPAEDTGHLEDSVPVEPKKTPTYTLPPEWDLLAPEGKEWVKFRMRIWCDLHPTGNAKGHLCCFLIPEAYQIQQERRLWAQP
jgi:hypothetical protein